MVPREFKSTKSSSIIRKKKNPISTIRFHIQRKSKVVQQIDANSQARNYFEGDDKMMCEGSLYI